MNVLILMRCVEILLPKKPKTASGVSIFGHFSQVCTALCAKTLIYSLMHQSRTQRSSGRHTQRRMLAEACLLRACVQIQQAAVITSICSWDQLSSPYIVALAYVPYANLFI